MRSSVLCAALVAALAIPSSVSVRGEVPVPRLSPASSVIAVAAERRPPAHATPRAPTAMGPKIPLRLAIKQDVATDVSRAVEALYERRNHEPLWDPARETALRNRLASADRDGLDPAAYAVEPDDGSVFSRAREDVSLTEAALRYARHAHSGRVRPKAVSSLIGVTPPDLNETRFLNRLAIAGDVAGVLEGVHPPHAAYNALRDALAAELTRTDLDRPAVGQGSFLRVGSDSPRVAVVRRRLGAFVPRGENPNVFDAALGEAVRAYQQEEGLAADGIVGPRTRAALDRGIGEDPVASITANLERWRWMPRELGKHHVFVNIPAFRVRVHSGGTTTYDGRVVVGRPRNPTPMFSDAIEHVVANPYWNVPYSIASAEMLPSLKRNPVGYTARKNLEVVSGGRVVNPAAIPWNRDTLRRVRLRQRPGRGNALGTVKFLFPNDYSVYLHDTPQKHLFRRERRAYSHGCVRVDDPYIFAEALLSAEGALSGDRLARMAGGRRQWFNVAHTIPVHLAYFTREVTSDGRLVRYEDLYGWDARTIRALGLVS